MLKHVFVAAAAAAAFSVRADAPQKLELKQGDHIAYIGNALADRMTFESHLETYVAKMFPQLDLTFRNLGFAGDEVVLRMRSDEFGSPDEWLTRAKTDVLFAFFGFNESFRGEEGLAQFKGDYEKFVKETLAKNYSGRGAPRLVLFSPIAHEKINDPNLRDPARNNANLEKYTSVMAEVAKANGVMFVDLFHPSLELYQSAKRPLTFNGIHLTAEGNRQVAEVIFKAVFGTAAPALDAKLQAAVVEKNWTWRNRYRTVDGYNVYGGRSLLEFPKDGKGSEKIKNRDVMQQEMAVRDVMTANRDKRVWALAKGADLKVDDSNVPAVTKIRTNKPGPNADESHPYLGGEEAITKFTMPKGVKANLFASEEKFPELIKPVQMAWDTKGRLWVSAWRTYPERAPDDPVGDRIIILEDTDGDGKADKCTTFLDDLNCATGFQFYRDGILLMQAPDLWFVRDTNGDGKADWKERVLMGIDSADSHHTANSMCLDPGGATYLSDGVFHRTQVETDCGVVRNVNGCIFRYEPVAQKFERYVDYGFANPHGRVFDSWGNDFITDATGNANYFGPAFSGRLDYPDEHSGMEQWWQRPSRPCPGTAILSSRAWPAEFNGNYLNLNVISLQGVFRVKMTEEGSGIKGETLEHFVMSSDPNFRPVAANVGPDGAVYVSDWANTIIGHMQHHMRDPNRDHVHGRIYRFTYEGQPLLKPAKIDGQPVAKLLELLKEPEDNVRERAKIELGEHDSAVVAAAVDKWVRTLNASDKDFEHHMMEALWVKQWHNVVDAGLLKRMLASPDHHARFAATRVLCYWRDRVPDALDLLRKMAADDHPRVRLEAVRAASFFDGRDVPAAIDIAQSVLTKPTDYYLDYTYKETMRQLQKLSKEIALPSDPAVLRTVLDRMSESELNRAPSVEPVLLARIVRPKINADQRARAVTELAKIHQTDVAAELATVLGRIEERGGVPSSITDDLGKQIGALPADQVAKARAAYAALAGQSKSAGICRVAWAALIKADGNAATTWGSAKDDHAKKALAESLGAILDPGLRAGFQPMLFADLRDPQTPAAVRAAELRALPLMGPANAKENFTMISAHLQKGLERAAAAGAMMQLPRDSWDKAVAAPVAQSVLAWAKTVPASARTEQAFVETLQAGMEMAALLPPDQGTPLRKELRGLGVSTFVIKTVREQMRYDTQRIVVEAGKPFRVIFQNEDFMPHNLLVVEPGKRQAVAEAAMVMKPGELDKKGRAFVPKKDSEILAASKLLEAGQQEILEITAPRKAGDYEYVCTFPGHWMLMWGRLIVTKDVDAYIAAHPSADAAPPAAQ